MPERDSYEVIIEQVPESLNKWKTLHWGAQERLKKTWIEELVYAVMAYHVPKDNAHVNISATIWFNTNRRRDVDNYASVLWKMTQDGLVEAGIIPDDTPGFITTGIVDLRVDKDCNPRTVLTMEVC